MGRDSKMYPEPNKFKPERWSETQMSNYDPFQFPVFHGGPRICLGKDLAILETKLTIAETLLRYKFTLNKVPKIPYVLGIPLTFNGDLSITFERR